MSDHYMTHKKELSEFVGREVIYCVSQLVSGLGNDGSLHSESRMLDDFPELYQGPPTYGEWTCPECDHKWEDEPEVDECPECKVKFMDIIASQSEFTPTEYAEIYEHWIVTNWLANRLEEKGEAICKDFYGLVVWGRTTSGQSIALDSVISEIHKEMSQ